MKWNQISKLEFTEDEMKIVTYYCKDDMKQLKKICDPLIANKNVAQMEYDDLYSNALNVLIESVKDYNGNKSKFFTYLIGNIKRSFYDWTRDRLKWKRCNLETDENGKVKKDGSGLPIPIKNIPLDAPNDDGVDWSEKIESDFNIENESDLDFETDDRVEEFLNTLSKIQEKILRLKMANYTAEDIQQKLNISNGEYIKAINSIKMNKNLSIFTKNINDGNYKEEKNMAERIIEIGESENYRMDKYTMFSLLQDKKSGDINCNYILQREPFQWSKEEANRYFCRILSNLPIPEIIICEQKKKGLTIAHLIDGLQRLSYAEAFKENRMKIGSVGAERHLIQYREYILDKNRNRVLDEDGLPTYEVKVFDVIGRYYKDLPDELKKRFNNFNINVTKFFDCTEEQIADHIRDYNNHASMNKEQCGLLSISERTANYIKNISKKNTFFKNCGSFTDNSHIKGKVDRIIAEAIMLLFHRNDWRANLESTYKYIDENATEQEFLYLNSQFNRLELALGDKNKELKKLFTATSMPMWISVFDKFTTYNIEDSHFVDFLELFNNELKDKFAEDFKNQQSKKKSTISGKIDLLVEYMNEFLHIEKAKIENDTTEEDIKNIESENTLLGFVKENVDKDVTEEEISDYEQDLDDIVRISSPIYQKCKMALIAMMAYVYKNQRDVEFTKWMENYQNEKTDFSPSQKTNYIYIKNDFNKYINA